MAYVHTYIRTYVHTYVRTYIHTYKQTNFAFFFFQSSLCRSRLPATQSLRKPPAEPPITKRALCMPPSAENRSLCTSHNCLRSYSPHPGTAFSTRSALARPPVWNAARGTDASTAAEHLGGKLFILMTGTLCLRTAARLRAYRTP